jgi:hypothetical protein
MKANFFMFMMLMCGSLISCVKKNTPEIPLDNTVDTTMAMQQNAGVFMNGPYGSVSGKAVVYEQNGSLILALQDMHISNGPALHVYISREAQPVNFIDLGPLQSTVGNQLYAIPGRPDFSVYRYALVHCKKYNHLFGSAGLE